MSELPDELYERIQQHCAEGDELVDNKCFDEALTHYSAAWKLLPSPPTDWDAAIWILAAIADVHFQRRDFVAMRTPLMTAIKLEGATANPFLRLRLGQCQFELGELSEAANWLAGAFLEEGNKIFAKDDPKYLAFIKSELLPPQGGWPEGW